MPGSPPPPPPPPMKLLHLCSTEDTQPTGSQEVSSHSLCRRLLLTVASVGCGLSLLAGQDEGHGCGEARAHGKVHGARLPVLRDCSQRRPCTRSIYVSCLSQVCTRQQPQRKCAQCALDGAALSCALAEASFGSMACAGCVAVLTLEAHSSCWTSPSPRHVLA